MKIPDSEYRALYSQLADMTEQRDKALADKGRLEEALRDIAEACLAAKRVAPVTLTRIGGIARRALAGVETGPGKETEQPKEEA